MTIPTNGIAAPTAEKETGRYTLQNLSRAIDVLDILAANVGGISVSDVARAADCSKSTAFAVLQTLEERNLVSSSGDRFQRRYKLGLGLARLGQLAVDSVSVLEAAMPYLEQLTAITRLSARVATLSKGTAVVLGQVDGPNSIRFDLNMGGRERLHCTGIGKAILSQFTDQEVIELAEQTGLPTPTAKTIPSIDALITNLALVRKRGFAVDDEEDALGILCVGAAIFDHTGNCTGGVSVTGLKAGFTSERVMSVGAAVTAAAQGISRRLGAQL